MNKILKQFPSSISLYCTIALASIGAILSQYLIFYYAPTEYHMGIVQKIFYMHLPLAWWALISFFIVCLASIIYLKTRKSFWDVTAAAAAEVGMVFCSLVLITGILWGRHSWGTWWTWDPRLTTALILWFLYAAYLIIRTLDIPQERKSLISAVVGIIAFLDVPLVFLSARLWRSIHPTVFNATHSGLDLEMKYTVIFCIISFGFFWWSLLVLKTQQGLQSLRLKLLQ